MAWNLWKLHGKFKRNQNIRPLLSLFPVDYFFPMLRHTSHTHCDGVSTPPISYSNFHNKKAFWELGMPATAHRGLFFLNKGEKEQEVLQRQDLKPMMETESMNTQVPHLSTGITWRCIVYGSNWLDNTFHCLPCLFCLISPHLCQYFLSVPLKLLVLKILSLDQLLGNPKPISNPWLP